MRKFQIPVRGEPKPEAAARLGELLGQLRELGGSDLHLGPETAPRFRVDGRLVTAGHSKLSHREVEEMVLAQLPERQREILVEGGEVDYAFTLVGVARFRGTAFLRRGQLGAVYRIVSRNMQALDALGLPEEIMRLADLTSGLVLTSGPVGSGKSTTLAAIVDRVNRTRRAHIVTVEDPVEFLHANRESLVTQRQVGHDTESFHSALRSVLRADPDVVVIGEIRDRETADAALRVTETGHLALATVHARSVLHAITRIVELFPPDQHRQIRNRLSVSLEAVLCQRLVPKASGTGRVLAAERLLLTPAARNLIREDKLHQLFAVMHAGAGNRASLRLDDALLLLLEENAITLDEALLAANDREALGKRVTGKGRMA